MEYVPIDKKYPPEWTNLDGNMVLVPIDIIGETWTAMEQLVDAGICRTIGVCNFATPILRQLLSCCRIRPSTLQIEVHPQNTQSEFVLCLRCWYTGYCIFHIWGILVY
jgi:D-xylose reductase